MTAATEHTTRRAMFAGVAVAAVVVPAVGLASLAPAAGTDAQFLEWERQADFWRNPPKTRPRSDEETAVLVDRQTHFEDLIAATPATTFTAARVKASFLLYNAEEGYPYDDKCECEQRDIDALRTLIDFLNRGAA